MCRRGGKGGAEVKESKFYRLVRPVVPKFLRPLVLRYQELTSYIVVGALTTLVNFVIYFPLSRLIHYLIATSVAWAGAVVFAFFANKVFVFEDERWDCACLLRQAGSFTAMRLLSWGMEVLMMWFFVERLDLNSDVTKVAAQVVTVVLNYIFSKLLIFRKKKG